MLGISFGDKNLYADAKVNLIYHKFIKDLGALYSPGGLVKILVLKEDEEAKKLAFSMKASHFEDDDDTDESNIKDLKVNINKGRFSAEEI